MYLKVHKVGTLKTLDLHRLRNRTRSALFQCRNRVLSAIYAAGYLTKILRSLIFWNKVIKGNQVLVVLSAMKLMNEVIVPEEVVSGKVLISLI